MTKDEFAELIDHIRKRMPDTGEWIIRLPIETRRTWFDEMFSRQLLEDCKAAVDDLAVRSEPWRRELFPAVVCKSAGERRWLREDRERQRRERADIVAGKRRRDNAESIIDRIGLSGKLETLIARRKEYRERGQTIPDDTARQIIDELFADEQEDDPTSGPRYRCLICRDSGLVSFRQDGLPFAGHCRCSTGDDVRDKFESRRRKLGPAPIRERSFDEFNGEVGDQVVEF